MSASETHNNDTAETQPENGGNRLENESSRPTSLSSLRSPARQRFVLTDHVALRLFEEDPSVTVLVRRQPLEGYELYVVEQWACSRTHPTFVITTYSGDPKDVAWGSIVSVPADESAWSPQLRVYFKELDRFHARQTETKHGIVMVTNLGAFPSSLTVIPVPGGDVKRNMELLYVNVDLKRLGCSGRIGIKLGTPNSATQAKFHQLYRTSDKNPINAAVVELVRMCQIALIIFKKLSPAFADGLLCDCTERAIGDWWADFGAEYYTAEPHDGILGPTTVAALLGMLMGARNRLSAYNAPVGKDAFDLESTKRAISSFQKSHRLERTGFLDRQTLERLRRATAKAASKETWTMPKALKSTVAELSGKGGEMVMGMVGGDKAGIAEIETVDIDRFVDLVNGEQAKWLWHGKRKKTAATNMFSRLPGEDKSSNDDSSATSRMLSKETTQDDDEMQRKETDQSEGKAYPDADGLDKEPRDPFSKRAAIKRATEKLETGTGFHRIKGAVGRRTHQYKTSKDDAESGLDLVKTGQDKGTDTDTAPARRVATGDSAISQVQSDTPRSSFEAFSVPRNSSGDLPEVEFGSSQQVIGDKPHPLDNGHTDSDSFRNSIQLTSLPFESIPPVPLPLRRTRSWSTLDSFLTADRSPKSYPRHLSFSIAEDSVLTSSPLSPPDLDRNSNSLEAQYYFYQYTSTIARNLHSSLENLSTNEASWTAKALAALNELVAQATADATELEQLRLARSDDYQALRDEARDIVGEDRNQLNDALRDIEVLGAKLEYEIQGLRGRVEDVEEGVQELERQVEGVEMRERELDGILGGGRREGWIGWALRMLTGVGIHWHNTTTAYNISTDPTNTPPQLIQKPLRHLRPPNSKTLIPRRAPSDRRLLIHQIPIRIMLHHIPARIPPVIKYLASENMPTDAPHKLIPFAH
ncbi:hypothetical protein M011DRAFT_529453 [Sporormia fimetaria CBS 119925]|uniref:Uncharacterized protein n=1 Tax=Sporormia fimetaria CBS 119925 TaxID=1340428 RepID=A0A6A6V1G2_9PLEO|nr:hypothetical protein M011DRAFT_529453 [Sporormia fimetaria CBS 119925]